MTTASRFDPVRREIDAGLSARAYPAAAIEVGRRSGALWQDARGRLTFDEDAAPCRPDTIFDLASLTKVIATASLAMQAVSREQLSTSDLAADLAPLWRQPAGAAVTLRDLLDHSSGLRAHAPLWKHHAGRTDIERAICDQHLDYEPRAKAVYSDLGFILMGLILERTLGATLDRLIGFPPLADNDALTYLPAASLRERIAPTGHDAWRGRLLRGEVHDENAAALGGVAGHAGMFGTAGGVGAFARLVLETFARETVIGTPADMRYFATKTRVPGSSRALGWDTMLPTSSCGTLMSPTAIGHTGYTGTTLWIDWERDLYVVFLTNRVHPTRGNDGIRAVRPRVHDAVVRAVGSGPLAQGLV
jgi:CubicO group peptidase (beta-lactamase class C family)